VGTHCEPKFSTSVNGWNHSTELDSEQMTGNSSLMRVREGLPTILELSDWSDPLGAPSQSGWIASTSTRKL
jgi:hypothetical protein